MKIAYTMTQGRGELDKVLADFAFAMSDRGVRTCGIVQINTEREDCGHRCDMDVQVLPDGPIIRISQHLGTHSRGCRLDPGALEQAVAETAKRMSAGFDLFILNKFGKQEADGRGFRDLIAEALAQDAAVLAGTNEMNRAAFEEFASDMALFVEADLDALLTWYDTQETVIAAS